NARRQLGVRIAIRYGSKVSFVDEVPPKVAIRPVIAMVYEGSDLDVGERVEVGSQPRNRMRVVCSLDWWLADPRLALRTVDLDPCVCVDLFLVPQRLDVQSLPP